MNIFTISYLYMEGNENPISQLKKARDNWQIFLRVKCIKKLR